MSRCLHTIVLYCVKLVVFNNKTCCNISISLKLVECRRNSCGAGYHIKGEARGYSFSSLLCDRPLIEVIGYNATFVLKSYTAIIN